MSVFVKINSFSNIFDLNRKILPCFKRKQEKWIRRFGNHENMSWTCYYSKIIVTCIYLAHRMQQPIPKLHYYNPVFRRKQPDLLCLFRIHTFKIGCWIRWARYWWISMSSSWDLTTHNQFPNFIWQMIF